MPFTEAANNSDYTSYFQEVAHFYRDDFDASRLCAELQMFNSLFQEKVTLQECLSKVRAFTPGQKTFFSEICHVVHLM
ncbi:hypothetical protein HOLleu_23956 [Holothuria leucospilota]|uniref:Uncharacterized protein n=1 Tax=Holothuria leucospilota TaxID=206669 RepID=A0A9Q1H5X9_HOLLE|nr:hypothetical protein HOLleu_23956 [Holothuria leucospilota]